MKRRVGVGSLVIAFFLSLFLISAEAQTKKGASKGEDKTLKGTSGFGFSTNSRAPIDITSDTVEANQKQNMVTFKGNVVAKQEDITLYANAIVVYYNPDTKKLKEIRANGDVRITQLDRRATGQRAIFDQDENRVTLEGDAVLREGENVMRGERVIYYVDEGRSVVEPGKGGRVSTTISTIKKD
jgi:lipopolysaccharide export system protein LptA